MTKLQSVFRGMWVSALVTVLLVVIALPAGAETKPQPIDATDQGGEAFIAFTVMVFLFVGSLFFMDRIRRRRGEPD